MGTEDQSGVLNGLLSRLSADSASLSVDAACDLIWLTIIENRGKIPPRPEPAPAPDAPPSGESKTPPVPDHRGATEPVSSRTASASTDPEKKPEETKPKELPRPQLKKAPLYPFVTEESKNRTAFRSPSMEPISHPRAVLQYFRNLRKRVPVRGRCTLDEEATVDQAAERHGFLFPVVRHETTRWLEVAVVADIGPSMLPWQPYWRQYYSLLAGSGIFRDVRLWHVDSSKKLQLLRPCKGKTGSTARFDELRDTQGRRVVMIVTDTVSPGWQIEKEVAQLEDIARTQPVVISQVLPDLLWSRTLLGYSPILVLSSSEPGVPTARLGVKDLISDRDPRRPISPASPLAIEAAPGTGRDGNKRPAVVEDNRIALPIIATAEESLESIQEWTRMVAGKSSAAWGRFLRPRPLSDAEKLKREKLIELRKALRPTPPREPDGPLDMIARFESGASQYAIDLIRALSATPLYLPLIRIIQSQVVKESTTQHLAEVFLSGLLVRVTPVNEGWQDNDEILFEFVGDVRKHLLEAVSGSNIIKHQEIVSEFIESKYGKSFDFRGLLDNPASFDESRFDRSLEMKPFAWVACSVLRRLGGQYARLADQIDGPDVANRILVLGSDSTNPEEQARNKRVAIALGEALARAGFRLVTGGLTEIDNCTRKSFTSTLAAQSMFTEDSVTVYDGELDEDLIGEPVQYDLEKIVRQSTAAMTIHGGATTLMITVAMEKASKPVVPLAFTGGMSAELCSDIANRLLKDGKLSNGYCFASLRLLNEENTVVPEAIRLLRVLLQPAPPRQFPKAWVSVAGSDVFEETINVMETAHHLGEALADAGYGLVTEGWGSVSSAMVDSFYDRLRYHRQAAHEFLRQYVRKGPKHGFSNRNYGKVIFFDRNSASLEAVEALILIGGPKPAYDDSQRFAVAGKIVIPIPFTGGAAQRWYEANKARLVTPENKADFDILCQSNDSAAVIRILNTVLRIDEKYRKGIYISCNESELGALRNRLAKYLMEAGVRVLETPSEFDIAAIDQSITRSSAVIHLIGYKRKQPASRNSFRRYLEQRKEIRLTFETALPWECELVFSERRHIPFHAFDLRSFLDNIYVLKTPGNEPMMQKRMPIKVTDFQHLLNTIGSEMQIPFSPFPTNLPAAVGEPGLELQNFQRRIRRAIVDERRKMTDMLGQSKNDPDFIYNKIAIGMTGSSKEWKTEAAIEYARRWMHEYTAVIYFSPNEGQSIPEEFVRVASASGLKVPSEHDLQEKSGFDWVAEWLTQNRPWLLITNKVWTSKEPEQSLFILGSLQGGELIYTDDLIPFGTKLSSTINVDVLDMEGREELLTSRFGLESTRRFVEALGGHILSLELAASCIRFNKRSLTSTEYLEEFKAAITLVPKPDDDSPLSAVLSITMNRLNEQAANLLEIIAFLDSEPIPRALFETETAIRLLEIVPDKKTIKAVLKELENYALIHLKGSQQEYVHIDARVHRLIRQNSTINAYELPVVLLAAYAPGNGRDIRTWRVWEQIALHIEVCLDREMPSSKGKENSTSADAEKYICSVQHEDSCLSVVDARLYLAIGYSVYLSSRFSEFQKAINYLARAREISIEVYGDTHFFSLQLANTIMEVSLDMDEDRIAETVSSKAIVAISEILKGLTSEMTEKPPYPEQMILNGFPPAIRPEWISRMRIGRTKESDDDRFRTALLRIFADAKNNDARHYVANSYYRRAVESLKEALMIYEALFQYCKVEVLVVKNNLGAVYFLQAQFDQAEQLFREVLKQRRKILGEEHPDTLTSMNNLGRLLLVQGKEQHEEAQGLIWNAAETAARVLGMEHPLTLSYSRSWALALWETGDKAAAEHTLRDVVEKLTRVLGENHRDTLETRKLLEAGIPAATLLPRLDVDFRDTEYPVWLLQAGNVKVNGDCSIESQTSGIAITVRSSESNSIRKVILTSQFFLRRGRNDGPYLNYIRGWPAGAALRETTASNLTLLRSISPLESHPSNQDHDFVFLELQEQSWPVAQVLPDDMLKTSLSDLSIVGYQGGIRRIQVDTNSVVIPSRYSGWQCKSPLKREGSAILLGGGSASPTLQESGAGVFWQGWLAGMYQGLFPSFPYSGVYLFIPMSRIREWLAARGYSLV